MNTGVQRSGATPPAARTANTKPVGPEPGNVFGQGKNVPLIAMAHEIPYVATATVAEPRDLEAKVERAMELRGARYIHVFVPCPLGWGSASRGHDPARPAGQGDGPVPGLRGRARRGHRASRRSAAGSPVDEYLRLQRRFAHLFEPEERRDVIDRHPGRRRPQHRALRPARRRDRGGADGQAVRDHARRRHPASPTRPAAGAPSAPSTSTALPPCNDACPAGEDIQAWLYDAEEGGELRARLAEDHRGQPVPGDHGPGLLPPVRDRLQPRPARRGGRASTRSSASSATRRSSAAGRVGPGRRAAPASACSSSAPGRPGSRPPTSCAGSATR